VGLGEMALGSCSNLDKKYIFMKNDPKKGPNPSKRDEILAEGFDGLC